MSPSLMPTWSSESNRYTVAPFATIISAMAPALRIRCPKPGATTTTGPPRSCSAGALRQTATVRPDLVVRS
jgi:hypothetical protein